MLARSLAVVLFAAAFAVQAQSWPAKPIRWIVPYPPGGATDVAARSTADKVTQDLGQQVVVENRGGGGGSIGTAEVARAAPDGYMFLFAADPVINLPLVVKELSWNFERDFVPITQTTIQPIAFAVHASVPAGTLQEFIALAKKNPGKYSFAHSATGSGQHLSGELFKKMTGVEMVHIPYKGGGPAVQDLVAGQVPVGVLGSTPLVPHHRAGRVKILAFTTKDRFPIMPEIPTMHESGLTGFDTSQWLGLLAPRGTAPEIVARMHAAMVKALAQPDVKQRLASAGMLPVGNTPQQFAAVIRQDVERWSRLANELGIKPQ
jgi:tripartite-type tricarboxylate transporter receptor subunit TctC